MNLTSLEIVNCEMGTISSRADHSVKFYVVTPELRASEAGALMQWHGRACSVTVKPHDGSEADVIKVDTERERKSAAQRLRAVLFVLWKQRGREGTVDVFYEREMEKIIDHYKGKLE